MESISAMVDSILSRSCALSTVSVRSRSSVRGVRKSCEIAASNRVRLSIKFRSRFCMSLKARAASRVSVVPTSGRGGASTSCPSRSAAVAREASGEVTRRTAHTVTARMIMAMMPIESTNCAEKAGPPAGRAVANASHGPSARGMETCRSRKAANPPNPCIIGPCPIRCHGPNGGPPLAANEDLARNRIGLFLVAHHVSTMLQRAFTALQHLPQCLSSCRHGRCVTLEQWKKQQRVRHQPLKPIHHRGARITAFSFTFDLIRGRSRESCQYPTRRARAIAASKL